MSVKIRRVPMDAPNTTCAQPGCNSLARRVVTVAGHRPVLLCTDDALIVAEEY